MKMAFSAHTCRKCNLIASVLIVITLGQFEPIHAGSFYQRGFPDVEQALYQDGHGFDFSPIQPLPVREILTNHGLGSSRNGQKFTPGSKVDVLFVDLNDIEKKPFASPEGGRIVSNSIQIPSFVKSVNKPYNNRRQPKQFQQQMRPRNFHETDFRTNFKIERVESLPTETNIEDILRFLPQIEAQIDNIDKQEVQNYSGRYERQNYAGNRKNNKNSNSRTLSRQSKRTSYSSSRNNNNDDRRNYREVLYY